MGVKHKAKLNDESRLFVVQQLACFETQTSVLKELKEIYGIELARTALQFYDPSQKMGEKLSTKWKKIFFETRKNFVEDIASIDVSHLSVRLRMLARAAKKAEQQGNLVQVVSTLENVAKEMGGVFTNKQKHEHTFSDEDVLKRMAAGMKRARSFHPDTTPPARSFVGKSEFQA